jgi:curved DNA-binding protein CbpA
MMFPPQQGLFKFDLIDHHAVLGVPIDADVQQIRQRYLKIAYRLHPDTCKAQTSQEKRKANKLLSKLVNPAYEKLSKEKSLVEYLVVLSQIGKKLTLDGQKMTLASDAAKKLSQAGINVELVYKTLMQSMVSNQYVLLEQVIPQIAEISELNLVYLTLKQGQGIQEKSSSSVPGKTTSPKKTPEEEEESVSPSASYLRRAQESLDRNNCAQAILELRDALKLEPNNSTCHGLMGLAYLKQNQLTMAKVHINKAWQLNPKDPIAIKSKQDLDQLTPSDNKTKTPSDPSGNSGIFGSLFGGKKK